MRPYLAPPQTYLHVVVVKVANDSVVFPEIDSILKPCQHTDCMRKF